MAKPNKPSKPIKPAKSVKQPKREPLTVAQRLEIIRRVEEGGEKMVDVARDYGVTRQAVSNFYRASKNGQTGAVKRLSPEEESALAKVVQTTLPSAHGLRQPGPSDHEEWTKQRVHAVAEKMTGRPLFLHPFRKLIEKWFGEGPAIPIDALRAAKPDAAGKAPAFADTLPQRKRKHRLDPLGMPPPEMWERLMPGFRLPGEDPDSSTFPPPTLITGRPGKPGPLERTGKHKRSKGAPFTKARKKKNR